MAAKILVVDDELQLRRLILQLFRRHVRNGTYEFLFAQSGAEALEILRREEDIAVVLCDINMPGMNGFDLLAEIPAVNPLLRTVMVSAYGDMKNIRRVMNLGAYDFVTKPIDFNDLEATIGKTLREVEVLKQAKRAEDLAQTNEQLRELDRLKSQFFTNISHDLRTPLTVITGMTDQIQENPERWLDKGLRLIKRNGQSLLDLVNQILDLRKLEAGKLELQPVQGDVIPFLAGVIELFESPAEQKDIRLRFQSDHPALVMDHDPGKLLRVLSNLLANALKFTPEGGEIDVLAECRQERLELTVKDTGTGIPAEKLPFIFDRFYQVPAENKAAQNPYDGHNEGSGVGLAIVRELVKLMGGTIEATSVVGEGTAFRILMPISRKAEPARHPPEEPARISPAAIPGTGQGEEMLIAAGSADALPSLLIVEDNADLRQYLVSLLEGRYRLDLAVDGQEGFEKAVEKVPDLIVSDVMMPRKDGFALCRELKTDERTSHIPIVLLTAKADDDSRISGLEKGADAYLPKPFNKEELMVRLAKLLELRQQLQKRYGAFEGPVPGANNMEDAFIAQIRQAIEANIDDENFGIEELSRAVGMSRSQLHRKIKALTGLSTSHFVRSIRVHRARALLLTTDLNISQVAYEVGFRDPKYFNRSFNEVFGYSPKEVRKGG